MQTGVPRFGKVLHVITSLESIAGAERSLLNLVQSDLAQQSKVIALRSDDAVHSIAKENSFREVEFTSLGCGRMLWPSDIARIRLAIKAFEPDLIVSWMYHANVAAALADLALRRKVPLVWSVHHGLDRLGEESISTKIAILASAALARVPSAVTYVSERVAGQHRRLFGLARYQCIVPNALDMPEPGFVPVRSASLTVGFAARHHPIKNYPAFFAIVREIQKLASDVRFIACGSGVDAENPLLVAEMRRAGLEPDSVELLGNVACMDDFYRRLDVLVLASKAEAFGMVLAEAIFRGVPCASADVGSAREIIGNAGVLIDPRDPAEAARRIVQLLALPKDRVNEVCRTQAAFLERTHSRNGVAATIQKILSIALGQVA
jgi:glycosyltransferase involved in cell wall biosynthesis